MVAHHKLGLGLVSDDDSPFSHLSRLGGDPNFGRGLAWDRPEGSLQHRDYPLRVDVSHNHPDGVVGGVEALEVGLDLRAGEAVHIVGPPDDGHPVGVRNVGRRHEPLPQQPAWAGLDPKPPFFQNDVALPIELTEDRVGHPVALQVGPQLQLVRRKPDHVVGAVLARPGVETYPPVASVELRELVLDHVAGLLRLQG